LCIWKLSFGNFTIGCSHVKYPGVRYLGIRCACLSRMVFLKQLWICINVKLVYVKRMSVLNLDAPPEVEKPCYLCTHSSDFLLQIQDQLSEISGKQNMYAIMYESLKRRTNQPLQSEHPLIGYAQFKKHFEEHLLSLRACITRDIREVKKMQARLLKDIYGKETKAAAINSYIRLSQHKISIANKLKTVPKREIIPENPYEFD
jgi:hypothetical protein